MGNLPVYSTSDALGKPGAKQRQLQQLLENPGKRRILQRLTQIGGVQRYTDELRQALVEA